MNRIGVRREDKTRFEARIPLTPEDIRRLREEGALDLVVQSSSQRAFTDEQIAALGVPVVEDVRDCDVVLGVKEMPESAFREGGVYVFFSHVIKGQPYNMPMLQTLMQRGGTLIDYERIVDDDGRRLVAFGVHAGLAGAIDSLWALGQRWQAGGRSTPLQEAKPAHAYDSLAAAKAELARIALECRASESFAAAAPVVVGVTGYGRVAQGAHEVLDELDPIDVAPEQLAECSPHPGRFLRVRFEEEHFAEPNGVEPFSKERYYEYPETMRGVFSERYLPHLTVLVNAIYWDERYPRLVTKRDIKELYRNDAQPRLQVIGDVSCDIEGSIEITHKATTPDQPIYTYDADRDSSTFGLEGRGPTVMAVDILPTELPREASAAFSSALAPLVPELARHDFRTGIEGLSGVLRRAVVVDRGRLSPDYAYLAEYLNEPSRR